MTESAVALVLLSVIAVCAVVLTATVVLTARDMRQTLRHTRRFLASVHHTASQVDLVVSAVSAAAAHAVHQFVEVKHRLERWLHHTPNGNGTGAGSGARPFRHRRRG